MKLRRTIVGPPLLAVLTFLAGVLNIASAFQPALPYRLQLLREILPLFLIRGSRHIVALAGFMLLITANGIRRKKRIAWWLAFGTLLASIVFNIMKGLDYEEALFITAVAVLFVYLFPDFRAGSDIPTIRKAFVLLAGVVFFNIAYGLTGFYLMHRALGIEPSFQNYLVNTLLEMFSLSAPAVHPETHRAYRFLDSLWFMWEIGLLLFLIMLLRPVIYRHTTRLHELEKARDIAARHGKSALVYFTLWEDKYFFFNKKGTCYIAYRQEGDVAVTLGDPVGPAEDIAETIREYVVLCENNGWHPAFYQVLPEYLDSYKKAGLRSLHIGYEAIIDLESFNLSGGKWRHMRNTLSRFSRQGFKAVWHHPPLDEKLLSDLKKVSDNWLYYQGGEEKGFSLGWFQEEKLKENTVVTVEDRNGTIYAFANFIPMYTLSSATTDMMRFSRRAPNGVMDFLFLQSILYFKERGVEVFNLGLAPLAHVGREESSSLAEKAVRLLYENLYNFKGLYNFKSKYSPRWEPRFLIYSHLTVLPKVALAIVQAGNPSGFKKFIRWWAVRLGGGKAGPDHEDE
ncbi:MAG: phosphatidylglycerol lysyltransferase domain-containing protein [Bacillota bacterium]